MNPDPPAGHEHASTEHDPTGESPDPEAASPPEPSGEPVPAEAPEGPHPVEAPQSEPPEAPEPESTGAPPESTSEGPLTDEPTGADAGAAREEEGVDEPSEPADTADAGAVDEVGEREHPASTGDAGGSDVEESDEAGEAEDVDRAPPLEDAHPSTLEAPADEQGLEAEEPAPAPPPTPAPRLPGPTAPPRSPAPAGPSGRPEEIPAAPPPVAADGRPAGPTGFGAPAEQAAEPPAPHQVARARIVAIANQKGGVGKSTTAVNLGAALAELGKRVLVMDLDPQGNASTGLGIDPADRSRGTYQILAAGEPAESAVHATSVEGVWAIPSTIDLAGAEIELVGQFSREMRLARAMEAVARGYDFVFLDCPPSLGLLTVNALSAADELIVPIQCEYYALEGLGQLLRNVRLIQQNLNARLRLSGIVLTMFDPRTRLSDQVVQEVRRYFGPRVYDAVIPRSVRLSEAPGFGKPITAYDPRSKGARAYRNLAREMLDREAVDEPLPEGEPPSVVSVPKAGGEEE